MATGGLQYPVASEQSISPALPSAPAPPQHKRTYQACIPCRKRKVRCDLGSVDDPHDPPCVRCRRESKECYFSATRRKRKPADEGLGDGEYEDEYEIRNGRKRLRSRSDSPGHGDWDQPEEKANITSYSNLTPTLTKAPLTPGGSVGRPQPLRRPQNEIHGNSSSGSPNPNFATRVPRQSQYGPTAHTPSTSASAEGLEDDAHVTNSTAAALIRTEVYNGHDALNLLFEAAGRTGDIGHRRVGSHGSSQQSTEFATKINVSAEKRYSDRAVGSSRSTSQPQMMGPPKVAPPGVPVDPAISNNFSPGPSEADDAELQVALKAWAKFRFIRAGWFSAREAIAYIDYFYTYLVPLTPIQPPDFQSPSTHAVMLRDEPILTVTLLTVSSRYMKLPGPGGVSRSYAIHEKLWTYLRGMIERMIWGQEQFGGGLRAAAIEDDSEAQTSSTAPWRGARKGNLRTLGTVESLMLLTEWHPRALHFPPGDDGDELVVQDELVRSNYQEGAEDGDSSKTRGIGGKRLESYLEPAWRSDRMCWMLMGNAMALSFELGVFDDVDESTTKPGEQHRPEYGQESYRIRAKRVQKLLVIFVTQLAGRLEWNANMVPQHISSSIFPKIPSPQQEHANINAKRAAKEEVSSPIEGKSNLIMSRFGGEDTVDNVLHCWLDIANIMKRGNELLFRNKEQTRDHIRSGRYVELLSYFQPLLREWRRNFNRIQIPKHLRHIISIEGEYVRMYINSVGFQAVVERLTNSTSNDTTAANGSGSTGSGSPNSRSVPGSLNPSTLMSLYGGDQEFVKEVIVASRSLLSIVVEGLLPQDYLKHCPIRTYFRIISGAMFLLKTFALGAPEDEVAISLGLMDSTVHALRTCIVDDVHMGTRFADLLATLTSRIRARFVRMAANNNNHPNPSNPINHQTSTSGPPNDLSSIPAPSSSSRSQRQQRPISTHPPQFPDPRLFDQQWPTSTSHAQPPDQPEFIFTAAGRRTPNPLFGISTESVDLSGGNISIMPPPSSFGFAFDGNGNAGNGAGGGTAAKSGGVGMVGSHTRGVNGGDHDNGAGSAAYGPVSFENDPGNGYVHDWLALPLDPLLQYGAGVSQTEVGPDVGGYDMLEILLANNNEFDAQGGGAVGM